MIEDFKKWFGFLGKWHGVISFDGLEDGYILLGLFSVRYWWLKPPYNKDLRTIIVDGTYLIDKIEDELTNRTHKVNKQSVLRSLK
jgi:hypothetical protein